jgi:DNA-binding transcriptional regulator of glucitol operon
MRERWLSRRAIGMHLALAICLPGCIVATWWQVDVAFSGDSLGWLYSVEWPFFACFGTYVWWNLIHDNADAVGTRALRQAGRRLTGPRGVDLPEAPPEEIRSRLEAEDPEMAAYNAYLASLAEQGPKGWSRR